MSTTTDATHPGTTGATTDGTADTAGARGNAARLPARPFADVLRSSLLPALLLTALALAATFALDPFRNYQLAVIAATFCATAGLTLLVGFTGQLSLGHAVLMAAGGYGYAIVVNVADEAGLEGPLRLVAGVVGAIVVSGVLGLLLGLAGARLRGPYLAGLTLALVVSLPAAAGQIPGLGGEQGVSVPFEAVPDALRPLVSVEQWQAWIAVVLTALAVTPLAALRRSRAGTRMRAVHADETAARLAGVSPARVKVGAFVAGSLTAGVGGAVLCVVTQSVSPGRYGLAFSLLLVVAAVVGGLGSIGGAAAGSALVVLLPWLVDTVSSAVGVPAELEQRLSGNLAVLVFGVVLIAVTVAWPGGLAGATAGLRARLSSRLRRLRTTGSRSITER